jgi:hypothetical protein
LVAIVADNRPGKQDLQPLFEGDRKPFRGVKTQQKGPAMRRALLYIDRRFLPVSPWP